MIQGETDVYQHSCSAIANGIASLNTKDGMPPIISGLLMYKSEAQANERLGEQEAKKLGISWAKSATKMADLFRI